MSKNKGFTLIELLVIIAVIGVLATITFAIINPLAQIRKAEKAGVDTKFKSISTEIEGLRILRSSSLIQITGSTCSICSCICVDARSAACVNAMTTSWAKISSRPLPRDPWGNPYLLDENEGEGGACWNDHIYSAGPDHIVGPWGACASTNGADDYSYMIPLTC